MARGNPDDWKDKSIAQPDIVASQDAKFIKSFQNHDVSNPHPGFGSDPNILNEFGHTKYPKWVKLPNGESIIVENMQQENEALGKPSELRSDGPTVHEYVAAGYKASAYPPNGYASKSSEEEIEAAVNKEKGAGW